MLKIKFLVIVVVLSLVAIVCSASDQFSSKAEGDTILREISAYKTWAKITKEPLGFKIDGVAENG